MNLINYKSFLFEVNKILTINFNYWYKDKS